MKKPIHSKKKSPLSGKITSTPLLKALKFTPPAQSALKLAQSSSAELGHVYVGSEHLLLGLAYERRGVAAAVLKGLNLDYKIIRQCIVDEIGTGCPTPCPIQGLTPRAKEVIELSLTECAKDGCTFIGTEHLLTALLQKGDGLANTLLTKHGATTQTIYTAIRAASNGEIPPAQRSAGNARSYNQREYTPSTDSKLLEQFSRDLTRMAAAGTLDPVVGRDREIARAIQILARRQKNNPALIGQSGVGKTAIAEGLARRIVSGDVPEDLRRKRILSLDLSSMVAGTKYRGEFEERVKHLIQDVRKAGDIILFLDELHTIVGAGSAEGAIDAANIIKPALSRGDLQVLGATTIEEYRKYIEKDAALERRFQPILIEEPSLDTTRTILNSLVSRYEGHHNLHITPEAIEAAVVLSHRYIHDRQLPDKAIDLIDEAASLVRMEGCSTSPFLQALFDKVHTTRQEKSLAIQQQDFERAAMLRDAEGDFTEEINRHRLALQGSFHREEVTAEDVATVLSTWTGIPVNALTQGESLRLLNLEQELSTHIIGQEEAVSAIARTIRRGRTGLKEPDRPIGSLLFLGPTGVGKTQLCRTLACALFGSNQALVRFDMSEYMEKHSVSRLIGSPPGYVGHEEGGQLTERIRKKPYCVVLFDEIEKAHEDIWGILLQIMEEGQVTDSLGRSADFKNTVIIMTSNVGAARITAKGITLGFSGSGETQGETLAQEKLQAIVTEDLKKTFRPEFLNRLDQTVVFTQLSRDTLTAISHVMLEDISTRMAAMGLSMEVSPSAINWLVGKGFDPDYGARPLRRAIRTHLEDPAAELILAGKLPHGSTLVVDALEDGLSITPKVEQVALAEETA